MVVLPGEGRTRVSRLLERLRRRGWRLTPQRRAIVEVLDGEDVHLTAEEIHARARAILPETGLATVYNTLNELVSMGEVLEINLGEGPKRYDPNGARRHQHLVCVACGELLDVHPSVEPRLPPAERHGYEILEARVTFRGLCPRCRG